MSRAKTYIASYCLQPLSPTLPTVSNPGTSEGSPGNSKNLTKLTGNTGVPGTLCYQGGGGGTGLKKWSLFSHVADHTLYGLDRGILGLAALVPR